MSLFVLDTFDTEELWFSDAKICGNRSRILENCAGAADWLQRIVS